MATTVAALCKTSTVTSGTSNYVLSTVNNTGPYRTPKQAVADGSLSDGDLVHYMCWDTEADGDATFEEGLGTYTDATDEVSRTAADVFDSSDGPGSLVNWSVSGERDVLLIGIGKTGPLTVVGDLNVEGDLDVTTDITCEDVACESSNDAVASKVSLGSPTLAVGASLEWTYSGDQLKIDAAKAGSNIDLFAGGTRMVSIQSDGALRVIKFTRLDDTTTPANPSSSFEGHIYVKGGKLVIQYNDAGTVRYKYLDLTGTGVTWVHTTTAP